METCVKKSVNRVIFVALMILVSSINLFAEEVWKTTVFGDVGGDKNINEKYFKSNMNGDGSVQMSVAGNKGKISGSTDGLMFHYTEVPAVENFELSADLEIKNYSLNNQVSFGLMIRDEILDNKSDKKFVSNYLAAGPLNLKKDNSNVAFVRKDKKLSKLGNFAYNPVPGEKLKVKIKKSGDVYRLTIGNEEPVIIDNMGFSGDKLYIGTYVARNAEVIFSNINIKENKDKIKSMYIDSSNMKNKEYLIGQKLDLEGLEVTALTEDGRKKRLSEDDYIVSGFQNTQAENLELAINYNGVSEKLPVEIKELTLSKIDIKYYPAKTEYYKQDRFDRAGMVLNAIYNNGYKVVELDSAAYTLLVGNTVVTSNQPYIFEEEGSYKVRVVSNERSEIMAEFEVDVRDAELSSLEIRNKPEKTQYFKGEELDRAGMAVYAHYTDGSSIRLLPEEYTLDKLDSSKTGEKTVKVHHKGKTADLSVSIEEKELVKTAVTVYPKTTYYVGEGFDTKGMTVSRIYNNGDVEKISDYEVDTKGFDSSKAGEYTVKVETASGTVDLKTVVRAKSEIVWKTAIFGQSTKVNEKNFVKINGDKIEVAALSGGGKITGDHDGISFYYTELDGTEDNFVLSADIKVMNYAKKPHDGQESFGLMARDAIGVDGDSALSASNIALLGGFSGGTKDKNGTQLIVRTGVTAQNGAGSKGLQKIMIKTEKPEGKNTPYRLTLSKTNSGFTGKIDNGSEVLIYEPEIMKVQTGKMYAGFFAARVADIEVSNIELKVSAVNADPARVKKPMQPMEPTVAIGSIDKVSVKDYQLRVDANVDGVLTVKKGRETIVDSVDMTGGKESIFDTNLAADADTNFSIIFVPKDTQVLTSYKPLVKNFTVEMKTYQTGKNIYVSPKGSKVGDGSKEKPLDLDTAIAFVQPGQTIIVQDGRYVRNESLFINEYNDGKKNALKKLVAEKGARPVIDFNRKAEGVVHSGNYWYIYGLDFTHSAPNKRGYVLGGNHNIVELCEFYENGDTGMQISRTDYTADKIYEWPSYNLVKNCTSYNNADPSENNADGFAAKLTVGYGNVFDGCISHNNADDGWDLYTKVGRGKIGPVTIENCIVYGNGALEGKLQGNGDGNGFKLGGEGLNVKHIVRNSVAFGNHADGFTSNSNPGVIAINNIGFNNKRNINFSSYTGIVHDFEVEGFESYQINNVMRPESDIVDEENRSSQNYFYNGDQSVNSIGETLMTDNYSKFVIPQEIKRNLDGSIDFSFLDVK